MKLLKVETIVQEKRTFIALRRKVEISGCSGTFLRGVEESSLIFSESGIACSSQIGDLLTMASNHHSAGRRTRRQMLRSLVGGSLLFPGLLSELLAAGPRNVASADPLAPHPPHFPAKAKQVIFLYMSGGVSHVDSFDSKPRLFSDHGKKGPTGLLKRPNWEFKPRG